MQSCETAVTGTIERKVGIKWIIQFYSALYAHVYTPQIILNLLRMDTLG